MKNNKYINAAWLSICYFLLLLITPYLAWIAMVYSLNKLKGLLSEMTKTTEFDHDITYITSLYILVLAFAPLMGLLGKDSKSAAILLAVYLAVNLLIGMAYIKWGTHLQKFKNDFYNLKRQLVATVLITGTGFILFGISGSVNIAFKGPTMEAVLSSSNLIATYAPALLGFTLGAIFLRASQGGIKKKKVK